MVTSVAKHGLSFLIVESFWSKDWEVLVFFFFFIFLFFALFFYLFFATF